LFYKEPYRLSGCIRTAGRGKDRVFAGSCEHRMRFEDGGWKIAAKKVVLVNNDEVIDNLTFGVEWT
jgi:hypothetical protein